MRSHRDVEHPFAPKQTRITYVKRSASRQETETSAETPETDASEASDEKYPDSEQIQTSAESAIRCKKRSSRQWETHETGELMKIIKNSTAPLSRGEISSALSRKGISRSHDSIRSRIHTLAKKDKDFADAEKNMSKTEVRFIPWTTAEDAILKEAYLKHGEAWRVIQEYHFPNRSSAAVRHRFRRISDNGAEVHGTGYNDEEKAKVKDKEKNFCMPAVGVDDEWDETVILNMKWLEAMSVTDPLVA